MTHREAGRLPTNGGRETYTQGGIPGYIPRVVYPALHYWPTVKREGCRAENCPTVKREKKRNTREEKSWPTVKRE